MDTGISYPKGLFSPAHKHHWFVACISFIIFVIASLAITSHGAKQQALSNNAIMRQQPTATADASDAMRMLPTILSADDSKNAAEIYRLQKKADWKTADMHIADLEDKLLLGHLLAQRYLHHRYNASAEELSAWLDHYADHPEAPAIRSLALAKMPSLRKDLPILPEQDRLQGYGDDNGLSHLSSDSSFMRSWHKALAEWHNGSKLDAAKLFASLLDKHDDLSPWMKSAAAYWAFRSYEAIGNHKESAHYLLIAAEEPRSFYGILARRQLHQPLELDNEPVQLSDSDVLEMVGEPAIRRILALHQAGLNELAEQEIRAVFPQADADEKLRLLALASQLNLASVEISMAHRLSHEGRALDFAKYPVPYWQPKDGFTVNPALVYALARQESGFNVSAVSPGGALGVMQLMPQTASLMQKKSSNTGYISETVMNVTLGQDYIEHLLNNNLVDGNLIYMLSAYNAGPGRLQEWQQTISQSDPLYFLENIPMRETRHYVMQVMTNYWIYSELAGTPSISALSLANNKWPSYDGTLPTAQKSPIEKSGRKAS